MIFFLNNNQDNIFKNKITLLFARISLTSRGCILIYSVITLYCPTRMGLILTLRYNIVVFHGGSVVPPSRRAWVAASWPRIWIRHPTAAVTTGSSLIIAAVSYPVILAGSAIIIAKRGIAGWTGVHVAGRYSSRVQGAVLCLLDGFSQSTSVTKLTLREVYITTGWTLPISLFKQTGGTSECGYRLSAVFVIWYCR